MNSEAPRGPQIPELVVSSNVQIAVATPDQWQEVRDLKLGSLEQEPIAFLDADEGRTRWMERPEEEWRATLSGPKEDGSEALVMLARDGEKAMGMVQAVLPPRVIGEKRTAEIQHMFIDRACRGEGHGRVLLAGLIQRLKDRGDVDEATLAVVVTQVAALNLYRDLGFRSLMFVTDQAQRGNATYDMLHMGLKLK